MVQLAKIILMLVGAVAAAGVFADQAAEAENSEYKAQLKEAKEELKRTAKRLAEIVKEGTGTGTDGGFTQLFDFDFDFSGRPMLGVLLGDERAQGGVLVAKVTPGSAADQAGLLPGDKLVVIDGVRLDESDGHSALVDYMETVEAGQEVRLELLRDGEAKVFKVVPQAASSRWAEYFDGRFDFLEGLLSDGISEEVDVLVDGSNKLKVLMDGPSELQPLRLADLNAGLGAYFGTDTGVLVLEAPADGALKSGDVLVSINEQAVASARQARRLIATAEGSVSAEVMREKRIVALSINSDVLSHIADKEIRIIVKERTEAQDG